MNYLKISAILTVLFLISCNENRNTKPLFMATSFPVYVILNELAGDVADIQYIVPTGASPHTYAPKPSDVKKCANSVALFYIADNFDGWISDIPAKNKIKLIDFVQEQDIIFFSCGHNHNESNITETEHNHEIDPHFWFDPLTVKGTLNQLTEKLIKLYPEGKEQFTKNSITFSKKLDSINIELTEILSIVKNKTVFLHHPSFNYLLKRYNMVYGGAIEESPGKEPSPRFLAELVNDIKSSGAKAIFSEPQLNLKTAKVIADESGVKLCELNPEGSSTKTKNYRDILIFNANVIKNGLE
jgi:zinc transport system substrate-binding protein